MNTVVRIVIIWALSFALMNCRQNGTGSPENFEFPLEVVSTDSSGQIFITDHSGKQWDITHAVNNYGFDPNRFNHGLGPYVLRPIIEPEYISRGEPGFPAADDDMLVIGAAFGDNICAYRLRDLISHEIVDEKFDDTYVAVAY